MQYSLTFLALIGSVVSQKTAYTYSGSVPACGFTSTVIAEGGATETVPIPLASANCASSVPAPVSSAPAPVSSAPAPYSSAPAPVSSVVVQCSEYVDGQPQCVSAVVTQISDGQIQAPTSAPVPVCSEYVDGQPQCASSVPAVPVCSEYVDGQPQCASSSVPAVPVCSEYVDGQPQCGAASTGYLPSYYAPTGTGAAPVPSYTGPAIASGPGSMPTPAVALLAGALGALAML